MFKNLQELRLARKEKVTELNCLKSLTGNFDTSAMADEYEREVEVIGTELFGEEFRNAIPEDDGCVLELVGKSGSSVAV